RPPARRTALTALASLVSALAMAACQPAVAPAKARPVAAIPAPPPVTVVPVLQRAIEAPVAHVGRVEAAQRVEIRPRVAGHVEAVLFREGELVRAGQPLFRIDTRPFDAALERARADVALAAARQQLARSEAERAQRLVAEQAISREEAERRAAALAEAEARRAAADAALQAARLDREFAVIQAPIDGRVGRALVTVGNYVGAGGSQAPLVTLVGTSPLHVHVDVSDPGLLARLSADRDVARWRAQVVDAHTGRALATGPIDFADNEMSGSAGTLRLRARIDRPAAGLVPGQFVRVQLAPGAAEPALLVPDKAIGTQQGQRFVLVVTPDNRLEQRRVRVGATQGELRVITDGLRADERVVVAGAHRARPGMAVQPQPIAADAAPAAQRPDAQPSHS
ncbi:MAG TPA: efflux RND transporter periplasmic adaptor subunit, partial [Albitalea sp.]